MRPVIGLSAYAEPARWAAWNSPAVLLPLAYAEQVAAAGGVPVLLPPVAGIAAAVGRLDGLVLTGGGDIDPGRLRCRAASADRPGERATGPCGAGTAGGRPGRPGLPVLGICRGLQVLNVARGGTLHQHLPDGPGLDGLAAHSPAPAPTDPIRSGSPPAASWRRSSPAPRSLAPAPRRARHNDRRVGRARCGCAVPTAHHQAIDRLGDGLTATAWAADGVIEAVELAAVSPGQHPFVLAVQWHPEVGDDPRLFQALIAAATSRAHSPRPKPAPAD